MSTAAVSATAVIALAVTGCSTKSSGGSDGGGDGSLKTDYGVTDDEITLLELSDLSGVFKVISLAFVNGTKVWAEEVNANGGICDREIKLDIRDTAYKVDNAVPLYEAAKNESVGMINLGGSHIVAALKSKLVSDKMLTVTAAWASVNLDTPEVMIVGQTYDVEMINGLAFLQSEGLIADGDKIGHIYVDSEYGQNGLMGSKAYAAEHDIQIVEAPIAAADTDMTATVTKMKSEGVKAIAVTTPPGALTSIAVQTQAQGLEVPLIGNNPSFAPNMLTDANVEAALQNYYMESSVVPFGGDNEKANEILAAVQEMSDDEPNIGSVQGYTWGLAFEEVLNIACENGDMTRQGLVDAKAEISSLESDGLTGKLDFSTEGASSSKESYILVVDKSKPGALAVKQELTESEEAKNYKAPHQK
ncbi:ABC transporter substrate-binding protein [Blastococcus sp. Marseille-P5729]|uniref:ABC transporter substrate-binding protein n=1 Tax=Blastococcus sp. Marseille-P5729 TaxID=2086582 RepID=UPI00131E0817|nr:ABC transporter substrate-binding protein [Blastococcus sp. Marseille-P5729]